MADIVLSRSQKLNVRQIEELPQEQKRKIFEEWEKLVWNEDVQDTDQRLLNIRDLPEKIETRIPHWIMDRLKEGLNQS